MRLTGEDAIAHATRNQLKLMKRSKGGKWSEISPDELPNTPKNIDQNYYLDVETVAEDLCNYLNQGLLEQPSQESDRFIKAVTMYASNIESIVSSISTKGFAISDILMDDGFSISTPDEEGEIGWRVEIPLETHEQIGDQFYYFKNRDHKVRELVTAHRLPEFATDYIRKLPDPLQALVIQGLHCLLGEEQGEEEPRRE